MTITTRALLLSLTIALAGCGGDDDDDDAAGDPGAFLLTSDFTSSVYGWVPVAPPPTFTEVGPAEGDATAVMTGGRIAIVESTLGAVTLLADDLSIERNFSVADEGDVAPNPHGIAIVSETKAYVARYAQGTMAIVDITTGELTGTIDLADHDPDGVPDMDAVTVDGDRALVTLERLDETFAPRGDSEIAVIDTATDAVTDTIVLPLDNPFGRFRAHGTTGELHVACTGAFGVNDGGIVGLGPNGDAPHVVVTEEHLGGDVSAFAIADGTHGFAVVAIDFVTSLVPFDPSDGETRDPIIQSDGYDLRDVERVGDVIMVGDGAATAPGLRIFSLDGTEQTEGAQDVGLPPTVILAL